MVVKFTPTYCAAAHKIAYKEGCALKLWFCEEVVTVGLFVVVMDFVKGQTLHAKSTVSQKVIGQLRQTLAVLHRQNHVYGDLRGPNIVVSVDKNGNEFAKLLDFDWGGGGGCGIPCGYQHGDRLAFRCFSWRHIHYEHDEFMLQCLENCTLK